MRIGTRSSALALTQARAVRELLGEGEIVTLTTSGDRGRAPQTDKSRWVDAIEQALLDGEIDMAVHSAKDLPGEMAHGLTLLGSPRRAAPEDVLCGTPLQSLEPNARVGSSSLRRRAQLLSLRDDLQVVPISGNVDTRLAKLGDPDQRLDAIVLARAGLQRLDRDSEIAEILDPDRFLPSPGQGALALQGRVGDSRAQKLAQRINDAATFACLQAERSVAIELGASCHTPIGALARVHEGELALSGWVGLPDGSHWISDRVHGGLSQALELGRELAQRMTTAGARELLASAEEMVLAGR